MVRSSANRHWYTSYPSTATVPIFLSVTFDQASFLQKEIETSLDTQATMFGESLKLANQDPHVADTRLPFGVGRRLSPFSSQALEGAILLKGTTVSR